MENENPAISGAQSLIPPAGTPPAGTPSGTTFIPSPGAPVIDKDTGLPITEETTTEYSANPEWLKGIAAELQTDPDITKFEDVNGLALAYKGLTKVIGRDKMVIPKSPEEFEVAYKALGKPNTAAEYTLPIQEVDNEIVVEHLQSTNEWFRETAFENNLNHEQATNSWNKMQELVVKQITDHVAQVNTELDNTEFALRTKYGGAYDANLNLAKLGMTEFGGDELIKALSDTGAGRSPQVIEAFIKIGKSIAEDHNVDISTGKTTFSGTDIDSQIAEIMANPNYMDKMSPDQGRLMKEMTKLMTLKHGTGTLSTSGDSISI